MNTDEMAAACRSEIKRLSAVLALLEGGEGPRRSYKRKSTRRSMSAAARKKISAAQKARWKKQKAEAKA